VRDAPVARYRGWQVFLFVLCLFSGATAAWGFATDAIQASSALGFQVERTSDPAFVRITAVDPGGAADESGLRQGDLIELSGLAPGERYRILTGVHPHASIPLTLRRGARTVRLVYRGGDPPVWRWDITLSAAADVWMLTFAMLFAWRRAASAEARILTIIFATYVAAGALESGSWLTPSPLADVIASATGYTLGWLSAALLATYAAIFGRPLSRGRHLLTASTYVVSAAFAIYDIVRLASVWLGGTPWVGQTLGPDTNFAIGAIPYVMAIASLVSAMIATRGAERDRLVWSAGALGLFFGFQALAYFIPPLLAPSQFGAGLVIAYELLNIGSFIAPLGMTYALFDRRLLDIGFVLNRVAIFSAVSIIVVGVFVLAEWSIGNWLHSANHTANLVLDAAVALGIGLSINYVHKRVEAVLDSVFFRKRHDDETALRSFAREVTYITDAEVALARTVEVLERHAGVSRVNIALADGAGAYGNVSENDPAILALRASQRPVDLHRVATEFAGEFAYPMVSGGRFLGVLVVGPKRTGESFAPDESHAIEELAHAVGITVETLGRKGVREDAELRAALAAVQAAIVDGFGALLERIDGLRDARDEDGRRLPSESPGFGG
jgi:hypothetical protein